MLEFYETESHFQGIQHTLKPLLPLHERGIWADATQDEAKAQWPEHHPVLKGLVYKVGPQ